MDRKLKEVLRQFLALMCAAVLLTTLIPYEGQNIFAEEKEPPAKTEEESSSEVIEPKIIKPETNKNEDTAPPPADEESGKEEAVQSPPAVAADPQKGAETAAPEATPAPANTPAPTAAPAAASSSGAKKQTESSPTPTPAAKDEKKSDKEAKSGKDKGKDKQGTKKEAKKAGEEITVTFMNGSETVKTVTGTAGELKFGDIEKPEGLSKTGHTFGGWSLESGGTTLVEAGHTFTADTPLYAVWTVNSYKLTYDSQGGTAVEEKTLKYGDPVPLPGITKDHAVFLGWMYMGSRVLSLTMPDSPVTLTASWKDAYIVTFREEKGGKEILKENVTHDSPGESVAVSRPDGLTDADKTGYTFDRWCYGSDEEFKFGETLISGDTDVWRTYKANTYEVSFDANGGEGTADSTIVTYDGPWDFEPVSKLFKRDGYTFDGWTFNGDAVKTSGEKWDKAEDVTLDANWKANSYTVAFHGSGNTTGDMSPQTLTYDEETALTANAFGKYGSEYKFFAWNTKEDGSGKWYTDGQTVKNLTAEENGRVDLYANWVDVGKPAIKFSASTPSEGSSQGLDYSNTAVLYTYTVKDGEGGTGVDPASVRYFISKSEMDEDALASSDAWISADVSVGADGSASFTVPVMSKGIVYVTASDRAMKPDPEEVSSPDDTITFVEKGNVAYDSERALVIENIPPTVNAKADSSEAAAEHTVTYSAADADPSSGIKEVRYSLKEKESGEEAAAGLLVGPRELPVNLDGITDLEKIEDTDFTISDSKLNGTYELVVTAVDFCGNKGESEVVELVFDHEEPKVRVTMSKPENDYYFRADNCGITVEITDENSGLSAYTVTLGDGSVKGTDDGNGIVTFTADQVVSALPSGKKTSGMSITVSAEDKAGNKAKEMTAANLGYESGMTASFVLDTENPEVTKIESSGTPKGKGSANEPYDGKAYYYNDGKVTVSFTVTEENPGTLSLAYKEEGSGKSVTADEKKTVSVDLTSEGAYDSFVAEGKDLAGNPLVLSDTCENISDKGCEAASGGEGKVALTYGKVIDRTPPKAEITYTSAAVPYLYKDGNQGETAAAYYNKNISAAIVFTDTYGGTPAALDTEKLFSGLSDSPAKASGADAEVIKNTFTIDKDGVYAYAAYGTDRAGNPLTVVENTPANASDMNEVKAKESYKTENCENAYSAKFKLVRDTAAPQYTLSFPDVDASKNETVDGTTAYYGSAKTASFAVSETNFDSKRIGADAILDAGDKLYSNVSLTFRNPEGGANSKGGKNYSVSMGSDGVYAFAVSGEDKAGNKLVQSSGEKAKKGYRSTRSAGSGKWWTFYKVLDTGKPAATLTVDDFYKVAMSASGNAPDSSDYPYQKKKSAKVTIKGKDNSPINIIYDIDSKVNGNDASFRDAKYANNRSVSNTMKGEQEFFIKNIRIMDRAGNKISLNRTSHIYLDVTPPTNQIDKPQATIKATTAVTRRSADGRDLFNRAVTLKLTVKDPNPRTKSAGLQDVFYTVKVDGKTLTNANPVHNVGNEAAKTVGGNTPLTYDWTYNLTIPASTAYESNNIEVELWAKDKAGNESNKQLGGVYKFGIDTIGPQITVTYDNNSAQNGKYFKANRTATVTVTDRNVDDGKIRITTQVGVPSGYSYAAGGNVNGNSDTWRKTLTYASDGNYTLNISGTDALGNPATVRYEGTSPQDFVIDKTAPVIDISFDNNDVKNEKYYKADRTATVTIREHNFDSKVTADVTASNERDPQPNVPDMSSFASSGDVRTATIDFTEEGKYTITVNYTDMAGNAAQAVTVGEFVVDKTAPTLDVMDNSIEDKAYNGELNPRFSVDDTYYDPEEVRYTLTGRRNTDGTKISIRIPQDPFGGTITLSDFLMIKDFDDIYDLTLTAADKAGNSVTKKVKFSVNRFGSNFYYGDDASKELSSVRYYTNHPDKYVIGEQNVNKVVNRTITVFRDSQSTEISEGSGYTVTEEETALGYEYLYTLDPSNFSDEGNYSIIVQSKDEAGNINTNSSVKDENETKAVPFEFAVDTTKPTNVMTGADMSRRSYQMSELPVELDFADNMAISRIEVLYGIVKDGADMVDEPEYPIVLEGEELARYLEENGPKVKVVMKDRGSDRQFIVARTYDAAGNESSEYRWEAYVSASRMALFFANKPLFFGSIGGCGALVAILAALLARRKGKDGKEAA